MQLRSWAMKKMLSFKIDILLLRELDKTIREMEKVQNRKISRTEILESAIADWINTQRLQGYKLKKIGVDEEGQPIYKLIK